MENNKMRKLILTVFCAALLFSACYADRVGTVLTNGVTVVKFTNPICSAWEDEICGGAHVAADETEMNAILQSRRTEGMTCFVLSDAKLYRLLLSGHGGTSGDIMDPANWIEVTGGGGGGGESLWSTVEGTSTDIYYNSGLVGIGTPTPTAALQVVGNVEIGSQANSATGLFSIALGDSQTVSGNWSTAMGEGSNISAYYSTAMGEGNLIPSGADYSTAMGRETQNLRTQFCRNGRMDNRRR